VKWIVAVIVGAGVIAGLTFAFVEGREEIAREREREAPIKVAARISHTAEGDLIVTIDHETQQRMALQTAALVSETVRPEVAAYGRLQENPDASFVVRAPVAGVLRPATGRNWPSIGESVADGTSIGAVEPRLAPIERVDLVTRLSDARADLEAAEARVNTARAAFERARILNADNKNISDRALQEAEASLKSEEARVAAARRNVNELEAASTRQSAGTTPIPLTVGRGGEVVEILARPNETIESGQPILRVTRFDTLLARVDVPAGEIVNRDVTTARIVAVGQEDRPFTGHRISLAPSVDPSTLGEGFVFRLNGAPRSLRPGTAVVAYLRAPGASEEGVIVPYSGIVRFNGKTWVFLQVGDDKFSRREIPADRTTDNGVRVLQDLKPGDRVVIRGAQLLLSEEQKSQIQVGEEAEKK
jgi:RND family efflux transporter MFP subunit